MKESINLTEIHITGLCVKQKWNQTVQSVKYSLRRRGECAGNSSSLTSLLQLNKLYEALGIRRGRKNQDLVTVIWFLQQSVLTRSRAVRAGCQGNDLHLVELPLSSCSSHCPCGTLTLVICWRLCIWCFDFHQLLCRKGLCNSQGLRVFGKRQKTCIQNSRQGSSKRNCLNYG